VRKLGCALGSPKKRNDYSLSDYNKAAAVAAAAANLGCALGSSKKRMIIYFIFFVGGLGGHPPDMGGLGGNGSSPPQCRNKINGEKNSKNPNLNIV